MSETVSEVSELLRGMMGRGDRSTDVVMTSVVDEDVTVSVYAHVSIEKIEMIEGGKVTRRYVDSLGGYTETEVADAAG